MQGLQLRHEIRPGAMNNDLGQTHEIDEPPGVWARWAENENPWEAGYAINVGHVITRLVLLQSPATLSTTARLAIENAPRGAWRAK